MKTAEAVKKGVSIFSMQVYAPEEAVELLRRVESRPGRSSNNKLAGKAGSRTWRAGSFKGMPLYQLSLEERATCPSTCGAWNICYGNNMPFASRINPLRKPQVLFDRLSYELDGLDKKHPEGYSVRLHVLGDFFSVEYVRFWERQLEERPALNIYGYTHRIDEIGDEIERVWFRFQARFNVLQSDSTKYAMPSAFIEGHPEAADAVICPEQTEKADGCLDCGLCTVPRFKGVQFLVH